VKSALFDFKKRSPKVFGVGQVTKPEQFLRNVPLILLVAASLPSGAPPHCKSESFSWHRSYHDPALHAMPKARCAGHLERKKVESGLGCPCPLQRARRRAGRPRRLPSASHPAPPRRMTPTWWVVTTKRCVITHDRVAFRLGLADPYLSGSFWDGLVKLVLN